MRQSSRIGEVISHRNGHLTISNGSTIAVIISSTFSPRHRLGDCTNVCRICYRYIRLVEHILVFEFHCCRTTMLTPSLGRTERSLRHSRCLYRTAIEIRFYSIVKGSIRTWRFSRYISSCTATCILQRLGSARGVCTQCPLGKFISISGHSQ